MHFLRVAVVITFGVGPQSIRINLQEERYTLATHVGDTLGHGDKESLRLPGITLRGFDPERRCACDNIASQGQVLGRALGIEIIFQDHTQGDLPFGSNIQGLVQYSFPQRPITNAYDCNMRHAGAFLGKRQASSHRGNAPLDAIAEKPLGADMLTTSPPTTHASLLPHELCNEALNIVGPGEVVPMAAVVAEQEIAFLQSRSNGNP